VNAHVSFVGICYFHVLRNWKAALRRLKASRDASVLARQWLVQLLWRKSLKTAMQWVEVGCWLFNSKKYTVHLGRALKKMGVSGGDTSKNCNKGKVKTWP